MTLSAAKSTNNRHQPTYVVLGSGGHTAEMCQIQKAFLQSASGKDLHVPVRYIVAKSDSTSRDKLCTTMAAAGVAIDEKSFIEVPRSREVGQSWFTTIFTSFWSLLWSFWLVWRDQPRLVLCNGPGTCVPFCVAVYLWRRLGRLHKEAKIVFVESFCRVKSLSLSGRLLLPVADLFVVQWPALAERYKSKSNVQYFGKLM